MSAATFAWGWGLELPAEPKLLLLVLIEACGMAREIDVDHISMAKQAGIPLDDFPLVLQNLATREFIDILEPAETVDGTTTVFVRYPLQDWDMPFGGGKKDGPRINNLPGWLYVMAGDDGVTKIGISNNVTVRLSALEKAAGRELKLIWTFKATITEVRGFEQKLLRMFAASRIRGEWFNADPEEVVAAAIEVCGGKGERP